MEKVFYLMCSWRLKMGMTIPIKMIPSEESAITDENWFGQGHARDGDQVAHVTVARPKAASSFIPLSWEIIFIGMVIPIFSLQEHIK